MYDNGQGITKNYVQAASWYLKAAEQGIPQAQALLAIMYFKGQGVPKDYIQAYKWLNIASIKIDSIAFEMRDLLEKIMTPEQIAKAQKESQEFKAKH